MAVPGRRGRGVGAFSRTRGGCRRRSAVQGFRSSRPRPPRAVRAPPYPRPGARPAPDRYEAPPRGRRSAHPRHVVGLEEHSPAACGRPDRSRTRSSGRAWIPNGPASGNELYPSAATSPATPPMAYRRRPGAVASGFGVWGQSRSLQPLGAIGRAGASGVDCSAVLLSSAGDAFSTSSRASGDASPELPDRSAGVTAKRRQAAGSEQDRQHQDHNRVLVVHPKPSSSRYLQAAHPQLETPMSFWRPRAMPWQNSTCTVTSGEAGRRGKSVPRGRGLERTAPIGCDWRLGVASLPAIRQRPSLVTLCASQRRPGFICVLSSTNAAKVLGAHWDGSPWLVKWHARGQGFNLPQLHSSQQRRSKPELLVNVAASCAARPLEGSVEPRLGDLGPPVGPELVERVVDDLP